MGYVGRTASEGGLGATPDASAVTGAVAAACALSVIGDVGCSEAAGAISGGLYVGSLALGKAGGTKPSDEEIAIAAVGGPSASGAPTGGGASQIFYRGMSNAELKGLESEGRLSVRGESFVTQSRAYVEQLPARHPELYQNIVGFEMAPGTQEALVAAGARGPGLLLEEAGLGALPWIQRGMIDAVHIKAELGAITYGLRSGSADIFNSRIVSFSSERFVP